MSKFTCLFLCAVAASLSSVCAKLSVEEMDAIRKAVSPLIEECSKGHDDTVGSCFIGCFLKKIGIVDKDGNYNADVTLSTMNAYINSDYVKRFEAVAKKCIRVNKQPVSAGNEFCERAQMVVNCALEHKLPSVQYQVIAEALLA